MQALRASRLSPRLATLARRHVATTAPSSSSSSTTSASSTTSTSTHGAPSLIPLSNVEAQWAHLSKSDQAAVHAQLEELQKRDWKTLSVDEKKAAYYVAFGPHGPRTPVSQPGEGLKIVLSVLGLMGVAGLITWGVRARAPAPPKTLSREWQEASNERARDQKLDPITGISSEGYSGKGFVQN